MIKCSSYFLIEMCFGHLFGYDYTESCKHGGPAVQNTLTNMKSQLLWVLLPHCKGCSLSANLCSSSHFSPLPDGPLTLIDWSSVRQICLMTDIRLIQLHCKVTAFKKTS